MKLLQRFLFGLVVLSVISGCAKEKKISIAVIPKGTTHVFWKSIHAGAVKAAAEENIEIIWQGPQKEDDRAMQINVVENFISRGVSAIVLAPLDDAALVRPVSTAIARKIPVIIIDSDLKENIYSSFVATDNYAGGKIAAKHLSSLLNSAGSVLMMRYAEGSASTAAREKGFLDGISEFAPQTVLVSTDQYGGVTAESALQTGQNLLNRFTELDGIFCPNESTTFGMLRALMTAGKAGQIRFVGFDTSDPLLKGLEEKLIDGLVAQNPFRMGYLGVKTAGAVLRGESVEKRIDTGVRLVTKDNINDPEVREAISPDIEKWLGK